MNETRDYTPLAPASSQDSRLVEAVREYQAALETGTQPSRREFIARYPEIAADLAECLEWLEFLH